MAGECQHAGGHFPKKLSEPFCCHVHKGNFLSGNVASLLLATEKETVEEFKNR